LRARAAGDVAAWSLLAFVVAIVKSGRIASAFLCTGVVALFVGFMLRWIKPRLADLIASRPFGDPRFGKGLIAAVLVFMLSCSLATDLLGAHALFGAFLAGVVMPARGAFHDFIKVRLEHFCAGFLLPLFFVFSGLRLQVALLHDATAWLLCVGLILLALAGKLGGTLVTARRTGMDWRSAFALGVLMNTRGLIELIALNIGYDLNILSPSLFAMLVLMALTTTAITGPLLSLCRLTP
jgi:Kef-type K+ transport system membrane component KefB